MSRKVVEILKAAQQTSGIDQQLRVAAYCRVSTKHEEQLRSLDVQIGYYTSYIQNHSNWVLVAVYFNAASGTRTNQRPDCQKLMRDCAKRK